MTSGISRGRALVLAVVVLACGGMSGCAAALGAAAAAQNLQRGLAGVQQLVASSRSLIGDEAAIAAELPESPLAGTYTATQVLDDDTVRYYVRTASRPAAPIVDSAGVATGYALTGLVAASLDSLEHLVGRMEAAEPVEGRAVFFVEGTQPPDPNARTLLPAAYLGEVESPDTAVAERQEEELEEMGVDLEAPPPEALAGQGISHELFRSVAEGVFTLTPTGEAVFEQQYRAEDGRTLTLRLERISPTTLPD
ncbi:MAG TPA: hypothetical protein VF167_19325 [Longimicrobiaceae bacterium]